MKIRNYQVLSDNEIGWIKVADSQSGDSQIHLIKLARRLTTVPN